jgi:DNA-binding NarL/FixJ family response regulator
MSCPIAIAEDVVATQIGISASHTDSPFSSASRRVVIVKRDRMAAEFIRLATLELLSDAECVCIRSAPAALLELRARPAQLGIFGLSLPEMDGLDLVTTVIRERLAFRILIVSTRRDELVRSQLRPGRIAGFFDPEFDNPSFLSTAIQRVASGRVYFSPAVTAKRSSHTVDEMFTPHQLRIFAALCAVGDEKEAANMLGLSTHTVHGHSQRIKRKLGVSKLPELLIEGIRRGVIRVTPAEVLLPGFGGPIA